MPLIKIITEVANKREVVFDLARSVDLHVHSTKETNERIVNGRRRGLLKINETITWRAKHLGIYQNLTVHITELNFPNYFVDEMVKGAFQSFIHTHTFEERDGKTVMTDVFSYQSPFGIIGIFFDYIFLEKYMEGFLVKRNEAIKQAAESDDWKKYINLE